MRRRLISSFNEKEKWGYVVKFLMRIKFILFRRLYELIEHGYILEEISIEFLLFQYDVSLEIIDSVKLELSW